MLNISLVFFLDFIYYSSCLMSELYLASKVSALSSDKSASLSKTLERDYKMSPVAADIVSVRAVYGAAVFSGFTEQREATAAAANVETLPARRQLHKQGQCCVCLCERAPDSQPLMRPCRKTLIHCSGGTVSTPLCPHTKDCEDLRPAV